MADEREQYSFENDPLAGNVRARARALGDLERLLARLECKPDEVKLLKDLPLMVRWAMDVPGNIAWYEGAKRSARARQWIVLVAVVLFAIAAMGASAAPAMLVEADADAPVAIAQLAIFVAMAWGVLQVVAGLADQKTKLAGFAKASADLKELLYTFEETWRGKPLVKGTAIEPDFETALLQEVANARRIARAERNAYFGDIPSVAELAASLQGALDRVGTNVAALGEARKTRGEALASGIAVERQRAIEAKALVKARTEKLARVAKDGTPEQLATAKSELLDAEIAEIEARARFTMMVKGEMLNP